MSSDGFIESSRRLRARIDDVDDRLVEAVCERLALAAEIGALKRQVGRAVVDPLREAEIRARAFSAAAGRLSPPEIEVLYDAILRLSRARAAGAPE